MYGQKTQYFTKEDKQLIITWKSSQKLYHVNELENSICKDADSHLTVHIEATDSQ